MCVVLAFIWLMINASINIISLLFLGAVLGDDKLPNNIKTWMIIYSVVILLVNCSSIYIYYKTNGQDYQVYLLKKYALFIIGVCSLLIDWSIEIHHKYSDSDIITHNAWQLFIVLVCYLVIAWATVIISFIYSMISSHVNKYEHTPIQL